ncbi:DMT family transporter [uncultured Enterovirga sp.]|uniref:DMT family transporter n=1 Tax=uncultured Enterovirga sp. TaxID=2026352 RepID=UPI0035CAD092
MAPLTRPPAAVLQEPDGRPPDNLGRAVGYMLLAAAVLPGINACAKYLGEYSVIQITWARYAGHFAFMIVLFAPSNGLGILRSSRPKLQLLRSALHCGSAVLTITALGMVSLPTVTAISFLSPLIVTMLAPMLLGERLTLDRALAVAVGFAAALIIVRPGFGDQNLAMVLLLGNALCSANVQILSRRLAAHDRALTSNTYMVVIGFVLMSLPLPFVWRNPADMQDVIAFLLIGIFGGIGHYFLVSAYEQAPASFVSPFNYAQIVAATILGYVIFGQLPDLWTWVGAALITASGIYLLLRERRRGRA